MSPRLRHRRAPHIDRSRIAYYGFSTGATYGVDMTALESRIRAIVLLSTGLQNSVAAPEVDLSNFAPRVKAPVLMLNGREDFGFPVETSQNPLFERLGSPPGQKKHVILEGGHAPPRM